MLLSAMAVAIAVLLLLLVIFQAIDTFSPRGGGGGGDKVIINQTVVNGSGCIEQIITSNTSDQIEVIVLDQDEICDPFVTTTWRLHRVCNTVYFGFQGFCRNTTKRREYLALDLSMVNFPVSVGTPSPNLERYDVSGVGSVLVGGQNIAGIVDVDGDEGNQRFIDVDIRLGGEFERGEDIEIALLCIYEAR